MYMRWSLFLLSVCVALSACSMTPENPSETSEIFSGLNEDLEEKPLEVFKNKAVSAWLKELMVYTIFFFLMSGNVLLVDTQKGPTLQKVHML